MEKKIKNSENYNKGTIKKKRDWILPTIIVLAFNQANQGSDAGGDEYSAS